MIRGRSASVLLLGLLLACGGSESTPASAPATAPTTAPATAPGPTSPSSGDAAAGAWTPERLADLPLAAFSTAGRLTTPIPTDPAYDEALARLGAVVDAHATDPTNPWAVSHGLLARGADLRLSDGRLAIDGLFADYAELVEIGGARLPAFPEARGATRIEPHTDLLLKAMTEAGVSPDRAVQVGGQPFTVGDLYRSSLATTWLDAARDHASFASPTDVPWTLQALAAWAPPDGLRWVATDGTAMDLRTLTTFAVAVLVKESAFMTDAMRQGTDFQRQGQGIFQYTCGGAHLLQGAAYAVARGFGGDAERAAIEAQVPLMFYRLPRELRIYDQAEAAMPQHRLRLTVQRLKFLGHFLESMSKLAILGFFQPDADQLAAMRGAADQLVSVVFALEKGGAFDKMDELRTQDEQLYLDLVGDSAHALRGLELALGRGAVH